MCNYLKLHMKKYFLFPIICINCVFGQNINISKIDSLFYALSQTHRAMGSIAITKNGTLLYHKSIGFSRIDQNKQILATDNTKYRIGSITKVFTACIIMQLIEEGKISLSTTLDNYYPLLPNSKTITIENLLRHSSGLYEYANDPLFYSYNLKAHSESEMIDIIAKGKPEFKPGKKSSYNNSGFLILGYIIQKICNKSFEEVLKERICSKLALSNTNYLTNINSDKSVSFSYTNFCDTWLKDDETNGTVIGAAGGVVSTPSDLSIFIEGIFAKKLFGEKSLSMMLKINNGFGLGIDQYPILVKNKKIYGHDGEIDSYVSHLSYSPADSIAIAICTNGKRCSIEDVFIGVVKTFYDQKVTTSAFKNYPLSSVNLDQYIGVYTSKKLPWKLTVTKKDSFLILQATGESARSVDLTGLHEFYDYQADAAVKFNINSNEVVLNVNGNKFKLKRTE